MSNMTIAAFEQNLDMFGSKGLNIRDYIAKKHNTEQSLEKYANFSGEYYFKPHKCKVGGETVFFKKMDVGQTHAEVLLSRIYNKLGMETPIAYPWMDTQNIPKYACDPISYMVTDGVVTKDVHEVYPTAEHVYGKKYHTIRGLYKDFDELGITRGVRLDKMKELIMSLAFNNKDAGYSNSFWARVKDLDNRYDKFIPIDLGYSGRDSVYYAKTKEDMLKCLYFDGEHGYNGYNSVEEDRGTTIKYLHRLLNGETVDGIRLDDSEIIALRRVLKNISKVDLNKESAEVYDQLHWKILPQLLYSLEVSREDAITELEK